jgi:beta-glucosidase
LFPFGHGLGYTTFAYGGVKLYYNVIGTHENIRTSVDVTNTGARAGEEVVQLYIQDEVASIARPVKELRGFEKIRLGPGERRTVSFELKPEDLAFYNIDMERVVEEGWFTVFIGTSSADAAAARFLVAGSYKVVA